MESSGDLRFMAWLVRVDGLPVQSYNVSRCVADGTALVPALRLRRLELSSPA